MHEMANTLTRITSCRDDLKAQHTENSKQGKDAVSTRVSVKSVALSFTGGLPDFDL